jgi:hypothetical protein
MRAAIDAVSSSPSLVFLLTTAAPNARRRNTGDLLVNLFLVWTVAGRVISLTWPRPGDSLRRPPRVIVAVKLACAIDSWQVRRCSTIGRFSGLLRVHDGIVHGLYGGCKVLQRPARSTPCNTKKPTHVAEAGNWVGSRRTLTPDLSIEARNRALP